MEIFIKIDEQREERITLPTSGTVMEAIRNAGLPILADCGGSCACATCHVFVEVEWLDRLPPLAEGEAAILEFAEGVDARSRLSCQIAVSPELDGLTLELAPGARY